MANVLTVAASLTETFESHFSSSGSSSSMSFVWRIEYRIMPGGFLKQCFQLRPSLTPLFSPILQRFNHLIQTGQDMI